MKGAHFTFGLILAWASPEQERGRQPYASQNPENLARRIHHQLVTVPYYGVFDSLKFRLDGHTVTLTGEVTRPTLKSSAESAVKIVEGVTKIVNRIRVLPLSSTDTDLRVAAYRSIYGHSALNHYALQAAPPIHIVVDNGRITLEGAVASEGDKAIAKMQAESVPGAALVVDNLTIEGPN